MLSYLDRALARHSILLLRGDDGEVYAIKQPRKGIEGVYWHMLRKIQESTGHTVGELHPMLRERFVGDTTRDLDEDEWRYYIEQVREWGGL